MISLKGIHKLAFCQGPFSLPLQNMSNTVRNENLEKIFIFISYLYRGNELLKVSCATKLRIFLFGRKTMFRSQDIQVFVFLIIPRFTEPVTPR